MRRRRERDRDQRGGFRPLDIRNFKDMGVGVSFSELT